MKLSDFEKVIPQKILLRGKRYFENDAVIELEEKNADNWTAIIEGSNGKVYGVYVEFKREKIIGWSCDCPYGDLCKHVVAVLYEIRELKELGVGDQDEDDQLFQWGEQQTVSVEELFSRFKNLSDTEQRAVKIACLIWESFTLDQFIDVFKRANFTFNSPNYYSGNIRPLLDKLVRTGFLHRHKGSLRCNLGFAHELCERFFNKDADFSKITGAIRAGFRKSFWLHTHLPDDSFREMRFGRYLNEYDTFRRNYLNFLERQAENYSRESLLHFWLSDNYDAEKWESFPTRIQAFLLSEKLLLQTFYLLPTDEYFSYAVLKISSMKSNDQAIVARLLAQTYVLRGDWTKLESLFPYMLPYDAELLRGTWRLLHGDIQGAIQSFDRAVKMIRKETNNRKQELINFAGVFQILAQLQTQNPSWLSKIEKHISQVEKNHTRYLPAYKWFDALRLYLQNEKKQAVHIIETWNQAPEMLLFFRLFCSYWIEDKLVDREQMGYLFNRASANGYHWMAGEILALWNQLEPGNEFREVTLATYREAMGNRPWFYQLLPRIEDWEVALNVLQMLGAAAQKMHSKNDLRLIWLIDFKYGRLTAKLQSYGKNGWSKGRPITFDRLRKRDIDCMTDQDHQIVNSLEFAQGAEMVINRENVWKQLCNHPLLFLWESPSTAVQLLEGKIHLIIREAENGYRISISHPIVDRGIQIVKETPTRYLLFDIDDRLFELASALHGQSLYIPQQGADRIKETMAGLSGIVAIQSVFENEYLPFIEPDSRLHIHLLPIGDGFHVELYVKPFRDATPYVKPGEGEPTLITILAGRRSSTTRNLEEEKNRVKSFLDQVPALQQRRLHQDVWELEETEQCLQLLMEINPMVQNEEIVLEWPKGEKFRISKVASFDQLRLNIQGNGQWFEVDGQLKVDEETVLSMQELLSLSEQQGQFIELSTGKFLALTEEFRRRLKEAGGVMNKSKKGDPLQLHPLAVPVLENFISALQSVTTDQYFQDARYRLKKAFSRKYTPSEQFKAQLRNYQQEGFEWLHRCADWGVGVCLADDMGLGKTIQALAVLTDRVGLGPALVVAPASVCRNWKTETETFAPVLRPILFGEGDREATIDDAAEGDLIIVTYDLMAREHLHFVSKKFATVILDEAQAIKNRSTKRSETAMQLKTDFKMILTGTPLENHLGELWNLFQFINPGLLGSIDQFNERFTLPIEKYRDEERREQLRRLVQPFILRRRKDEVLKELPEKTEVTLTVNLPPEERAFYEALRRNAVESLTATQDSRAGERHLRILAELMRLRRAACHPALVDENAGFTSSAKLRLFAEIVDELLDNGHKALVFSQFVGHLKILETHLKEKKISYQYLDGQTPLSKRQERIEAFQAGQGDLFLISLKAGGVGLNLTAADYVIHTDPWWNPAVEDQATDRAHRIGQEKPVTVYRLVAENTIEEKILTLHEQKRDLADSLLAGTDVSAKLTADDLLALMGE